MSGQDPTCCMWEVPRRAGGGSVLLRRLVPSWLAVRVAEERAAVFTYISSDLE